MIIPESIMNNMMYSYLSPDVDRFERSRFISDYLKESKLTHREFCEKFNVPKSTLEGWLVFRKISPEMYRELLNQGVSETHISNSLKSTTKSGSDAVKHILLTQETFEDVVEKAIRIIKPYLKTPPENVNGNMLRLVELRDTVLKLIKLMDGRNG